VFDYIPFPVLENVNMLPSTPRSPTCLFPSDLHF